MPPGVLGQVVAAGEALGTQGTGEPLLACVRPVVAGQLVGTGELLVTARPITGKGPLTSCGLIHWRTGTLKGSCASENGQGAPEKGLMEVRREV